MNTNACDSSGDTSHSEAGFSLIEIVVSMLLLALAAIAFLPLAIQAIKLTATNATLATATQIVAQQLEQVGAAGTSCSAVKAFVGEVPAAVPHPRGALQPHFFLDLPASDVCPDPVADDEIRTVSLRTWVTKAGSTEVLAEATRLILLDAP